MLNLENSPGRWISTLHRYAQSHIGKCLKPYDIGSGQYIFLMVLYRNDGRKQEDLAKELNIDKGTTARAISNLEKHGYVTKVVDEADKRANRVYLTSKAYELKPKIHQTLLAWTNIITAGMSEDEIATALDLFEKMAANVVKEDYSERNFRSTEATNLEQGL